MQLLADMGTDGDVAGSPRAEREAIVAVSGLVIPVWVVMAHHHPHAGFFKRRDKADHVVGRGRKGCDVIEYRIAPTPAAGLDN
jgi:hypothetical protein